MMKPSDDTVYLRRDLMEALKRSDEKWKVTQERLLKSFSRKADEMMEKFLQNHEFSRNSNLRDELIHRENERWR